MNNDPKPSPSLPPSELFPHNTVSSAPTTMQHNSLSVSTHSPSPALSPSLPHQTNHTPCPPSPQAIKSEPGTVKPEPMDTASSNSTNMVESSTMQLFLPSSRRTISPVLRSSWPRCRADHLLQQFSLIQRLGMFCLHISRRTHEG